MTLEGKPVSNRGQWEDIDRLAGMFDTRWKWVKGHAGHELNEIVDEMARDAALAIART
jgi:ribonuclease HI